MIISYYAIFDVVAKEFGELIFAKNDGVASRLFASILKKNEHINPNDLTLYKIGDFNNESGIFESNLREVVVGDDDTEEPLIVKKVNSDELYS